MLISRASFQRVVREVAQEMKPDVLFKADEIEAVQHTTEAFLTEIFEEDWMTANHSNHATVMTKEIKLDILMHGWEKYTNGLQVDGV